jgi:hypothetical protein
MSSPCQAPNPLRLGLCQYVNQSNQQNSWNEKFPNQCQEDANHHSPLEYWAIALTAAEQASSAA